MWPFCKGVGRLGALVSSKLKVCAINYLPTRSNPSFAYVQKVWYINKLSEMLALSSDVISIIQLLVLGGPRVFRR